MHLIKAAGKTSICKTSRKKKVMHDFLYYEPNSMILRVSGFVFNMVCKRLTERAAYLWKALQIHTMAHIFYAFAPFVLQVH